MSEARLGFAALQRACRWLVPEAPLPPCSSCPYHRGKSASHLDSDSIDWYGLSYNNAGWWLIRAVDGHDDFPIFIRSVFHNHIHSANFTDAFLNGTLPAHVDLPRLKRGHVGGTFWSVFVPCPTDWTDFSDETYAPSM